MTFLTKFFLYSSSTLLGINISSNIQRKYKNYYNNKNRNNFNFQDQKIKYNYDYFIKEELSKKLTLLKNFTTFSLTLFKNTDFGTEFLKIIKTFQKKNSSIIHGELEPKYKKENLLVSTIPLQPQIIFLSDKNNNSQNSIIILIKNSFQFFIKIILYFCFSTIIIFFITTYFIFLTYGVTGLKTFLNICNRIKNVLSLKLLSFNSLLNDNNTIKEFIHSQYSKFSKKSIELDKQTEKEVQNLLINMLPDDPNVKIGLDNLNKEKEKINNLLKKKKITKQTALSLFNTLIKNTSKFYSKILNTPQKQQNLLTLLDQVNIELSQTDELLSFNPSSEILPILLENKKQQIKKLKQLTSIITHTHNNINNNMQQECLKNIKKFQDQYKTLNFHFKEKIFNNQDILFEEYRTIDKIVDLFEFFLYDSTLNLNIREKKLRQSNLSKLSCAINKDLRIITNHFRKKNNLDIKSFANFIFNTKLKTTSKLYQKKKSLHRFKTIKEKNQNGNHNFSDTLFPININVFFKFFQILETKTLLEFFNNSNYLEFSLKTIIKRITLIYLNLNKIYTSSASLESNPFILSFNDLNYYKKLLILENKKLNFFLKLYENIHNNKTNYNYLIKNVFKNLKNEQFFKLIFTDMIFFMQFNNNFFKKKILLTTSHNSSFNPNNNFNNLLLDNYHTIFDNNINNFIKYTYKKVLTEIIIELSKNKTNNLKCLDQLLEQNKLLLLKIFSNLKNNKDYDNHKTSPKSFIKILELNFSNFFSLLNNRQKNKNTYSSLNQQLYKNIFYKIDEQEYFNLNQLLQLNKQKNSNIFNNKKIDFKFLSNFFINKFYKINTLKTNKQQQNIFISTLFLNTGIILNLNKKSNKTLSIETLFLKTFKTKLNLEILKFLLKQQNESISPFIQIKNKKKNSKLVLLPQLLQLQLDGHNKINKKDFKNNINNFTDLLFFSKEIFQQNVFKIFNKNLKNNRNQLTDIDRLKTNSPSFYQNNNCQLKNNFEDNKITFIFENNHRYYQLNFNYYHLILNFLQYPQKNFFFSMVKQLNKGNIKTSSLLSMNNEDLYNYHSTSNNTKESIMSSSSSSLKKINQYNYPSTINFLEQIPLTDQYQINKNYNVLYNKTLFTSKNRLFNSKENLKNNNLQLENLFQEFNKNSFNKLITTAKTVDINTMHNNTSLVTKLNIKELNKKKKKRLITIEEASFQKHYKNLLPSFRLSQQQIINKKNLLIQKNYKNTTSVQNNSSLNTITTPTGPTTPSYIKIFSSLEEFSRS